MTETQTQIVWKCEACGTPIFGDTGYLGARHEEINSWGPIHWAAMHDRCLLDDYQYSVDLYQLRTPAQVLSWTAHLAGKNWYERSDWHDLMAAHGIDVTPEERSLEVREWVRREMLRTDSYGPSA